MPIANVIIYSKDRPAQLDLLLDSIQYTYQGNCTDLDITVIYKASTPEYELGYNKAFNKNHAFANFVREDNFKYQTLDAIDSRNQYTMFLVDDIVFYNLWSFKDEPFVLFQKQEAGVLGVSLRLGYNTTYCYPISRNQTLPPFHKKYAWKWTIADGDFGYPMSLDGNVFLTARIREILNSFDQNKFVHPNLFESGLNEYAQSRKNDGIFPQIMICYEQSKLFNNPCNRVQDVIQNKTESSYDPNVLNEKYLNTNSYLSVIEVIDRLKNNNIQVNAAHFPLEVIFYDPNNSKKL